MKKIGFVFLTILLMIGWMADPALAHRYGYPPCRGGIYRGGPVVVAPPVYPYGWYAPRPVVIAPPAVYVPPPPVYPAPVYYYPYVRNGWVISVP